MNNHLTVGPLSDFTGQLCPPQVPNNKAAFCRMFRRTAGVLRELKSAERITMIRRHFGLRRSYFLRFHSVTFTRILHPEMDDSLTIKTIFKINHYWLFVQRVSNTLHCQSHALRDNNVTLHPPLLLQRRDSLFTRSQGVAWQENVNSFFQEFEQRDDLSARRWEQSWLAQKKQTRKSYRSVV